MSRPRSLLLPRGVLSLLLASGVTATPHGVARELTTSLRAVHHRRSTTKTDRRNALFAMSTGAFALAVQPRRAEASYAMYAASQDSFKERKETGFVPVATNDRATLAEIQREISYKRPQSAMKVKKAPQYCAGQMASVQPMMENICSNIGTSKADQSNTRSDAFGNMNVGQFSFEQLEEIEKARDYKRR